MGGAGGGRGLLRSHLSPGGVFPPQEELGRTRSKRGLLGVKFHAGELALPGDGAEDGDGEAGGLGEADGGGKVWFGDPILEGRAVGFARVG